MYFGLKGKYYSDAGTKHFLRKLMALPLLPENAIIVEFVKLETIYNGLNFPKLTQLCNYMKNNWIYVKAWTPCDYCHFRMQIRTNNGVEGATF